MFSSDLSADTNNTLDCVRTFPVAPPTDELTRDTLGPWPDIPVNFWAEKPAKATWGAGTFASRVYYWCDYRQERMYEFIELIDVTFHQGDLTELLSSRSAPTMPGSLPRSAKPNDRLYEEHAHRAAALVRSEGIKRSESFRRVLKHGAPAPHLSEKSQERALRQAYGSMYDDLGTPHPN